MNSFETDRKQENAAVTRHGVAVILVHRSKLLVIERSQLVVAPGAFCFPGGGVQPGESHAEAVVREMQEELGIDVMPLQVVWESVTPWGVALQWWLASALANCVINANSQEVANYAWLSREQMEALPKLLASNRGFLQAWTDGEFQLPETSLTNP